MDEKACVGYVSEKKLSIWTGWPVWAVTEARKRLYGQVSLCGRCWWKVDVLVDELAYVGCDKGFYGHVILRGLCRLYENVRVDGLVCIGHDREKEKYAGTSKLVQAMTVKKPRPDERINVCVDKSEWHVTIILLEFNKNRRWLCVGIYRAPSQNEKYFI